MISMKKDIGDTICGYLESCS